MGVIQSVEIDTREDIVISRKALQTINEGLVNLLFLIDDTAAYLNSTYEEDFATVADWIKAHKPSGGEGA